MSETIGTALRAAVRCLEQHAVSEPRAAAEVLLADLLALPRWQLYGDAERPLGATHAAAYQARLRRRIAGEPVQYITGKQEFWSAEFEVTPQVLIPRPETELLVAYGVQWLQQQFPDDSHASLALLDVGTGSGNVAISLAQSLPYTHVWGVDTAAGALHVAQRNAQRLGVADRLHWICSDLLSAFQAEAQRFALCVANLPYVTTAEWHSLPREIKAYEPPIALRGGDDGLGLIRQLIVTSPGLLRSGGLLLLEVGWQHATVVCQLLRQQGRFHNVGVYHDFAGVARVVWAHRADA